MITYGDASGASVESNAEDAARFLEAWFVHDRPSSLVSISRGAYHEAAMRTTAQTREDWVDTIRARGLDDLVTWQGKRWNLYHAVGTSAKAPRERERWKKRDVDTVPGVWMDLDVKDGAFTSGEDARAFVEALELRPTLLVETGTGGLHAYWRAPALLTGEAAEELCKRWLEYARARAPGVTIDQVYDRDRIMRLPGSVRWPKQFEAATVARVAWLDGPELDVERCGSLSEGAWAATVGRRHRALSELSRRTDYVQEAICHIRSTVTDEKPPELARWERLYVTAGVEEDFNRRVSWRDVLEPLGWVRGRTDHEGRVEWSRPGTSERRSAVTDWRESPHVMSLFSENPATGLADLKELGVPLTKYRVFVQLVWGGREVDFLREWLKL